MIQNSQIRAIATKLIMAIDDPDNHLVGAINALAENNYTEMVDAASLALIVLVVDRSIKNGKGDTKKMAIKMVDSICHLTDPKDFYLYYPKLCAQLIDTLNDTIPLNRMIAAHTIGELSLKMNTCHSLSQQLIEMMNQSNTAISIGLSQGLAHVMSHLDQEYVEMEILPRVEVACRSEIVNIRGSFMSLFQFLPTAFGAKFEKFLPFALPVVIQGLSDHQLSVRDAALKSGQAIMSRFNDNIDLILPHLEKAMLDPNWQTRANSLQLLEGLFHEFLTATSKNGDIKDYSKLLSSPVRCRILACLYVLRFDPLSTVSKNAVSAWKTAVLNTGKTLRALVPTFISIIVNRTSYNEIWDLVLHTVGELVQKMGDHVLVGIISEFEKKMNSRLPEGTQDSVCIDVSEILQAAATKAAIHESKKLLFQIVLKGLCNSEPQVRKSAVKILDCLRKYLGESAIDEIFPKLIAQVDNPDTQVRQVALQGIQQILSFHSQHVLPALISKLLQQPISDFNARALASTAKAAGAHLTPFLHTILPTLIQASVSSDMNSNPVNCHLVKEALHSVLLVINTSETLGILFTELAKFVSDKSPELRHASLELICFYATNNQAGQAWLENISFAIHTTLKSYQDADPRIVLSAIDSLATVLSTINVEAIAAESVNVVKVINDTIEHLRFSETTEYLVYTKGFEPILKIYVAAMRNGSSLMREQASLGIRFLFSKSKGASLTPPMIQTVTGTLIRILSERQLESHIRSDILQTLNLVVDYGGSSLKHFSTTLQITYLKFISMPYKPIREQSAIGILKLVSLNPNIPFLVKALITVTKDPMNSNPDACLETVSNIFQSIGKNVDGSLCESMREALNPFLDHEDFTTRQRAAEAFASTLLCLPLTEIMKKVEQLLLDQTQNDKRIETGLLTLYHIMKRNPEFTSTIICDSQSIVDYIILNLSSPIELIRGITSQILALILAYVKNRRQSAYYAKILVKVLDDESIDVKIMALNAIRSYAKAAPEESAYLLKILVPPTLSNVKKNTLPLKCAAERALYCLFQVNKGDALYRQFIENLNEAQRKQFTLFYRTLEKLTDADETAGCVESQMFL
ncbi:uncharacterized protein LOC126315403 [Schistocerca gregaria]|uniref:uncharacterized protein LOC126315403 n=1 Tax=Schistocerca gregaria TaxID=7010 RepID=UPI00211DC2DC|nr:uncharacterized protein LOC126315403 [Schistocerca gregaria]